MRRSFCAVLLFCLAAACADGTKGPGQNNGLYHPDGWGAPEVHGLALKMQDEDCRGCHGDDLAGGGSAPVGCDDCHAQGWRTDCTFCHGGEQDNTGAPPRDLDGSTSSISFSAHATHISNDHHADWDCDQCHAKPQDVLSTNHVFDSTKGGQSELVFTNSLSNQGLYNTNGSCANLYCHGGGRFDDGSWSVAEGTPSCSDCHAYLDTPTQWLTMSGRHGKHLLEGIQCDECHKDVVSGSSFVDKSKHVDGQAQVAFSEAWMSRDANGCTGLCHFKGHFAEGW